MTDLPKHVEDTLRELQEFIHMSPDPEGSDWRVYDAAAIDQFIASLLEARPAVRSAPKITNEMKAAHIGEYSFKHKASCSGGDLEGCDGERCNTCDGSGLIDEDLIVPWDTCKQIFKGMYATFVAEIDALSQPPQPVKPEQQGQKCVCKEPNPERDPICEHFERVICESLPHWDFCQHCSHDRDCHAQATLASEG